jgi:predicted kinase
MLSLGCSVVLDWGLWTHAEPAAYRQQAEALGARVEVIFLDVPLEELWSRISQRDVSRKGTLHITRAEFEEWWELFEPPTD